MPKIGISKDYMSQSVFDIDKFKLEKNEIARIVLIEDEFDFVYSHWVDDKGYFVCNGNHDCIKENGSDVENCVLCKNALKDSPIKPPRRHFVGEIIRYTTNSRGELLEPLSVDVQPWVFGDDKYNDLALKKDVHGDLRKKDLVIKCTAKNFQRFQIEVAEAVYLKDKETMSQIVSVYKKKKHGDIERLLGRVAENAQMSRIVEDVLGTPTSREDTQKSSATPVGGAGPQSNTPKDNGAKTEATPKSQDSKSDNDVDKELENLLGGL